MQRVFIVEDDIVFVEYLRQGLEPHTDRFSFQFFSTGEECLRNIHQNPDVVVVDYYLNSKDKWAMDGITLVQFIKEFNSNISVVLVSGLEPFESTSVRESKLLDKFISKHEKTIDELLEYLLKKYEVSSSG